MCCHIVYVNFLYHSFHSFYFGTVSYISVFGLPTFPVSLSLCVSFHLLHAESYMISDERRCQESHWAEQWGMWPRQSALHSGGPDFKASLHPSTNCGRAAKVSVGEELFTGLFSVSSLLMREPAPEKRFCVSEQSEASLGWGEGVCADSGLWREQTGPLLFSFLSLLCFFFFFFFLFFLVLLRQGFYDNQAQSHWIWLTFSSLLFFFRQNYTPCVLSLCFQPNLIATFGFAYL